MYRTNRTGQERLVWLHFPYFTSLFPSVLPAWRLLRAPRDNPELSEVLHTRSGCLILATGMLAGNQMEQNPDVCREWQSHDC